MATDTAKDGVSTQPSVKLLDKVRGRIRYKHYSVHTGHSCVQWLRRFVILHGKRHHDTMGVQEVEAFLLNLANESNAAASTHLLQSGHDIRTVQELPAHSDGSTTMICTHMLNGGGRGVVSPLGR